jgi:hypothetical protein
LNEPADLSPNFVRLRIETFERRLCDVAEIQRDVKVTLHFNR